MFWVEPGSVWMINHHIYYYYISNIYHDVSIFWTLVTDHLVRAVTLIVPLLASLDLAVALQSKQLLIRKGVIDPGLK